MAPSPCRAGRSPLYGRIAGIDLRCRKLLWDQAPPAGSHSVPVSYVAADGRQMILVAAGGSAPFGSKQGDHIIAYALPRR